jgi:SAM-dependent methyltransferase
VRVVSAPEFFEAIARRYDRVYALDSVTTRTRMKRVISRCPPPPARVLDLGVGTGRELGPLQDAGYDVTGLDVSPSMLAQCARRARPVTLVEADLWRGLPFPDGSFDAVIALHGTLAHPPERDAYRRLAAEIGRIVRAGGSFVAEVPSQAWVARLRASGAEEGDGKITHVASDRILHEDRAAGVAIEAIVPGDDEWREAFGGTFEVECEALGDVETFVVGRRRSP